MNTQRMYNKHRESANIKGTAKQRRRKYRDIIKDLGARGISLDDIATQAKVLGLKEVLDENNATLDEAVVLSQYARAITTGDTKAAEFLRDTVGEKPSTQVDLNTEATGLSQLSYDELIELKDSLVEYKAQNDDK